MVKKEISMRMVAVWMSLPMVMVAETAKPLEPQALPAPDQPVSPVMPALEKVSETCYKLGVVEFDKQKREVRFPAVVNMNEGLLEFVVVQEKGKIHESLMVTKVSPTIVNTAIKLLRYTASPELYAIPNETGGLTGEYPKVSEEIKQGARMQIEVEYVVDGVKKRHPFTDWVKNAKTDTHMAADPWVYGGSEVYQGRYVPESTGDMIAIFTARSAMINYSGDLKEDDEVWVPFPKALPEVGTPVTIILSPYVKAKAKEEPNQEKK